jgi:hypothetical protein
MLHYFGSCNDLFCVMKLRTIRFLSLGYYCVDLECGCGENKESIFLKL